MILVFFLEQYVHDLNFYLWQNDNLEYISLNFYSSFDMNLTDVLCQYCQGVVRSAFKNASHEGHFGNIFSSSIDCNSGVVFAHTWKICVFGWFWINKRVGIWKNESFAWSHVSFSTHVRFQIKSLNSIIKVFKLFKTIGVSKMHKMTPL